MLPKDATGLSDTRAVDCAAAATINDASRARSPLSTHEAGLSLRSWPISGSSRTALMDATAGEDTSIPDTGTSGLTASGAQLGPRTASRMRLRSALYQRATTSTTSATTATCLVPAAPPARTDSALVRTTFGLSPDWRTTSLRGSASAPAASVASRTVDTATSWPGTTSTLRRAAPCSAAARRALASDSVTTNSGANAPRDRAGLRAVIVDV